MARPRRRTGNLPAEATSFIGRRRELAEVRKQLTSARLVSVVGPGGVGKTRLAIKIAADLARGFAGGAWFVELADLRDPALVPNSVMAALDLRDQASTEPSTLLLSYLRDKELLLVLDNCEHLLGGNRQSRHRDHESRTRRARDCNHPRAAVGTGRAGGPCPAPRAAAASRR